MKRSLRAASIVLLGLAAATSASAQGPAMASRPQPKPIVKPGDSARPASSAAPTTSASAAPQGRGSAPAMRQAGPLPEGATLPAGHPPMGEGGGDPHAGVMMGGGEDGDGEGHEGHDHGDGEGDPHAGMAGGGGGGAGHQMGRELPEDGAVDDPSIAAGTIQVHVSDPTGAAMPNTEVTLGIIHNSIAQGESRKRVTAKTNDKGVATFEHLDTGSGVAYRAMVLRDGATFSAPPFPLSAKIGVRAVLHVYPVVNDVEKALIVSQSMIYTEVKDDRIQIQQAFKVYNFGGTAWVPVDLVIPLPPEYTAFTTQQGMTDVGVDAVPNKGVKLRGTFSPGQHVVEFRWQLPYKGESEFKFDVGMAPHMAASRVIAPSSRDMKLEVDGFPPPQNTTDGQGQRALMTEKQVRREDPPVKSVSIAIRGLPTEGLGKIIATLLAAGGVAVGLVLGSRKLAPRNNKGERERLLQELEALERAHAAGDVGPQTYARARRELLDDIARTFADAANKPAAKGRRRAA